MNVTKMPCTPYCQCNQVADDVAVDQCDRARRAVKAHEALVRVAKLALPLAIHYTKTTDGTALTFVDQIRTALRLVEEERARRAVNSHEALVKAVKAVLDRSEGKLYNTDQETGETFDSLLRTALRFVGEEA